MISVRQASLDLFRPYGLITWFGNPGSSELTLLEDFPDDFALCAGTAGDGAGGDGRRLCPDQPTTRCGQHPHRAGHGKRPGRALQRTREQDSANSHRRNQSSACCSTTHNVGYARSVRLTAEIPPPGPLGRSFYELTTPAGQCCSGAPVSIRRDPWRAIGVYVGERRQPERRLSDTEVVIGSAVGYATRADALVQQWPQLFGATAELSELCPLPPGTPPWTPEP